MGPGKGVTAMKGCKPLSDAELAAVEFRGKYALRDRALFVTGVKTGLRVSELLSLRVKDVADRVSVAKRNTKGSLEGRSVVLHPAAREAIDAWVSAAGLSPEDALFRSREGSGAISRNMAYKVLKGAFARAGVEGKTGTHSMRKTFASKVYAALGRDLVKVKAALGHRDINSTVSYLSFETSEVDAAILAV
jgi:site-specific recombinase XerD